MKTNKIMDDIRSSISPEMKLQMEMSVAIKETGQDRDRGKPLVVRYP